MKDANCYLRKKAMKVQMEKEKRQAVKEASEKARLKEKTRADRLSRMIEGKTEEIQCSGRKIKELQQQLKRGTKGHQVVSQVERMTND